MKLIRISLARKASIFTIVMIMLTLIIWPIMVKKEITEIPTKYFIMIVVLLMLTALYLMIHYLIDPLNSILGEIKALLTGRKYNRIFTKRIDEIGIVAHFFNEMTHSLERASNDIKEQRRMSAELDIASKIQKDILPKEAPIIPGINVIVKTRSAAEIGGDSFNFIETGENTFMYIGDVTGHGVPAGLVMMMVDTLIHTFSDIYKQADEILIKTNKVLKPRLSNMMFMTLSMLRWNHPTEKLYMAGAGHEHTLIYKQTERHCLIEKSGGIALGMVDDISNYTKEREILFEKGDILVMYSDGITEAKNISGEMFGVEQLKRIIEKCGQEDLNTSEIFKTIAQKFSDFTGKHVQEDDMTIIIMKHKRPEDEHIFESTIWDTSRLGKRSLLEYN